MQQVLHQHCQNTRFNLQEVNFIRTWSSINGALRTVIKTTSTLWQIALAKNNGRRAKMRWQFKDTFTSSTACLVTYSCFVEDARHATGPGFRGLTPTPGTLAGWQYWCGMSASLPSPVMAKVLTADRQVLPCGDESFQMWGSCCHFRTLW